MPGVFCRRDGDADSDRGKNPGKKADYVLELKGNQGSLYEDVKGYFAEEELCRKIEEAGNKKKTKEKA